MPASTAEELEDDLASDLQWRRLELQSLRTQVRKIDKSTMSKPHNRMMLRASVVLLYAHWEGYTKLACQGYLDYVARRRLTYGELSDPIRKTAIRRLARNALDDSTSLDNLNTLVLGMPTARAKVPRKGVVDTGSNLRHEVLIDILRSLGLDDSQFVTIANLIDKQLCDPRNAIAHGRDNFPDPLMVEELFQRVMELLEAIKGVIGNSVSNSLYRR